LGQESGRAADQIIQAKDDIERGKRQGEIISNEIRQQFGLENAQSKLTQAYQSSFSGDLSSASVLLQSSESALKDSIISLLRSGQQLISVSQNQSFTLNDDSRDILNTFGGSLSNPSVAAGQIQSQVFGPQN